MSKRPYQRFAQCILWLEAFDAPRQAEGCDTMINRSVAILKCRNGPGHGVRIGFRFEGQSLRFTEVGAILGKAIATSVPTTGTSRGDRYKSAPSDKEDAFHAS
jgi:hypothetical protein